MKEEYWSINQASEYLGKSIITLRRWDESGDLTPDQITDGGHRRYSISQIKKRRVQLELKKVQNKKHTFFFDFDSCLYPGESLEEIIEKAIGDNPKKIQKIYDIGRQGMEGKITITQSLSQRLETATITQSEINQWIEEAKTKIDPKIIKLLSQLQAQEHLVYIVSGGFTEWITPLMTSFGFLKDHIYANKCTFDQQGNINGFLSSNPLSQDHGKSKTIQSIINAGGTQGWRCMIGDGATDLQPFTDHIIECMVGIGIYQQRGSVQEQAPIYCQSLDELQIFFEPFI